MFIFYGKESKKRILDPPFPNKVCNILWKTLNISNNMVDQRGPREEKAAGSITAPNSPILPYHGMKLLMKDMWFLLNPKFQEDK